LEVHPLELFLYATLEAGVNASMLQLTEECAGDYLPSAKTGGRRAAPFPLEKT